MTTLIPRLSGLLENKKIYGRSSNEEFKSEVKKRISVNMKYTRFACQRKLIYHRSKANI